jgi:hypothetical protein
MKSWILLLALLLPALNACSSAPAVQSSSDNNPAWILKPESAYPADRYLVSVGSGSNRELAIEDAKKSMAESFVVKVQSITESKANSTFNENTAGAASGESKQDTQKNVSLRKETKIRVAEGKEISNQGNTVYALLALDKLKARSGLLMESNRIKGDLENILTSLEDQYTQVKFDQAKAKFAEFESLYGEASALGMSSLVDVNPLEARLNRIDTGVRSKNKNIAFIVKTINGETYFERDIESCINDRGGVLLDKAGDKTNRVEISVVERPQHLPIEGWTRIRFDLTAAIIQSDGRKYRIQTTQTETARSRNAVMEAISDKLSQDLCNQLFNRINEMTTSQ